MTGDVVFVYRIPSIAKTMKKEDIVRIATAMRDGESRVILLGGVSEHSRVKAAMRSLGMEVYSAAGKYALRVLKPGKAQAGA